MMKAGYRVPGKEQPRHNQQSAIVASTAQRRRRLSATVFRQPARGFTLLEVLIAVVLLGILVAALYGSYFTVLKARERSAQGMEERRELGGTLDLLRREIDAARYIRGDKLLRFIVEDRDSFGRPASNLELTTLAPPAPLVAGSKESGVIDVQYRMVEKDEQKLILTRKEQDILLVSTAVPAYPQMERISSFLVECSNDGSKWVKSWDATLNGGLPKIVRITVQVEEQEGQLVEFSVYAFPRVTPS
jgi:general secretion pathway protein J